MPKSNKSPASIQKFKAECEASYNPLVRYKDLPLKDKPGYLCKKVFIYLCDKMLSGGMSQSDPIAELELATGISKDTASRIIKAVPSSMSPDIVIKTGRPSIFTDEDLDRVTGVVYKFHSEFMHPKVFQVYQRFKHEFHSDDEDWSCSEKTFRGLMKRAGFHFGKTKYDLPVIAQEPRIQDWCYRYLSQYNEYKSQGRHFYYQDETFCHISEYAGYSWSNSQDECLHHKQSSSRGAMLIIAHIGSNEGFVTRNGQDMGFIMESNKPLDDYHRNMNAHNFLKWMGDDVIPKTTT